MRITISQRLRPYSHVPGERCLIPGTLLGVRVFPALLIIEDVSALEPKEIARYPLGVVGPVMDFTVQQDLEKGCVRVWGHAQNGYFRYHISSSPEGYLFVVEKALDGLGLVGAGQTSNACVPEERLSLGVDKQQEWGAVSRRTSLAEILPFWLRLGQMTPQTTPTNEGTASLLAPNMLKLLFMTGFEGILFPRLNDASYQGISLGAVHKDVSPAFLLTQGACLIRSLFFQQKGNSFAILQAPLHDLHAGRFVNVACGVYGEVDFEWRSRKLRRLIFRCRQSGDYTFAFPYTLKTFRLREQCHTRGVMRRNQDVLLLQEGGTYFFDRFET